MNNRDRRPRAEGYACRSNPARESARLAPPVTDEAATPTSRNAKLTLGPVVERSRLFLSCGTGSAASRTLRWLHHLCVVSLWAVTRHALVGTTVRHMAPGACLIRG